MSKILSLSMLCILCCTGICHAQYYEMMRSLRPGQTVNPWTVGESVFQVHAGAETGWFEESTNTSVLYSRYTSGNAMLCYGITHKLEVDGVLGIRKDKYDLNNKTFTGSGVNIGALGARYNIYNGGYNGFSLGAQVLVKIPNLSDDYKATKAAPRIIALLGYDPSNIISITANVGVDYDGISNRPRGLYSLKSAFMLSKNLGTFIETYGSVKNSTFYNHIDLGLYCYITHNFMIDASAGMGVENSDKDEGFLAAGLTYRFSTIHKRHRWVYGEYRH